MATSFRLVYPQCQGRSRHNVNSSAIKLDSAVIITAAEIDLRREEGGSKTHGRPWLGEANVWVSNVGPHNPEGGPEGGVEFYIHADWGSPIDVVVTITVLDDIASFQIVR